MNVQEKVQKLRKRLEDDFAPMYISEEYVLSLLAEIGEAPKTCGSCSEPCGNDWCCMKDEK